MRMKTMAALGFAAAAVSGALAVGGVAYANANDPGSGLVYRIDESTAEDATTQYAPEDCPEKDGSAAPGSAEASQEAL